ncbi:MAG: hypothetical protein LBH47_03725 [Christensenellaceae bacterium]|jgi:dihydroxyacid dehydratase/phosphogluconate dehydratase|nr:hypothetical protein [Christensenellaceae bacterium]
MLIKEKIGIINAASDRDISPIIEDFALGKTHIFQLANLSNIEVMTGYCELIIKSNDFDCIILITDEVGPSTAVLLACIKTNCPIVVMPTGINARFDTALLTLDAKIALREIRDRETVEDIFQKQYGILPDSLADEFFKACKTYNLCPTYPFAYNSAESAVAARQVAELAIFRASNRETIKHLLTKQSPYNYLFEKVFNTLDIKYPKDAYHINLSTATNFDGEAWVYENLQDANRALLSGAIENGVIVVKYCENVDISQLAINIVVLNKSNEIAIATDGLCHNNQVLIVSNIDTESFYYIQTKDKIQIEPSKGKFTLNVTAKELKIRTKRMLTNRS